MILLQRDLRQMSLSTRSIFKVCVRPTGARSDNTSIGTPRGKNCSDDSGEHSVFMGNFEILGERQTEKSDRVLHLEVGGAVLP